ncbi:hypothetical protein ISN44_As11g036940 [Arabidopsis suecica]|uniref:Uncharacterized protein n=1 Tax=Arabidopsis suecica TaxID=45249 RepID=A0A8T1ZHU4_ARASU|nr:hypothetical protein ISN44_As11g036940 [Arabidopsis suecica]
MVPCTAKTKDRRRFENIGGVVRIHGRRRWHPIECDVYSFDEQFSSNEEEALENYSIVKRQLIESKDFTWSHGEG